MRRHAVQERRKLIKELTLSAKGRSSKASSTSASDAFPLGRVSSIPPLMPDAQAGGRGGEGDLSVDLGGLEASAHSGHKLVSVPHWGGVMDTTKAALKETADKERALNAKLAKVSERGREGQRGRRETGGQGGREKGREGVMCRCGVLCL